MRDDQLPGTSEMECGLPEETSEVCWQALYVQRMRPQGEQIACKDGLEDFRSLRDQRKTTD